MQIGLGCLRILERNFLVFKANLAEALLSIFIEPLVFYGALSYGLGQYVSPINGLPYAEFLFPGFLLVTSMTVSYSETSHNCYLKISSKGSYANYQYTPLTPSEVALGEILWGAFKGLLAGSGIAVYALVQGFFTLDSIGFVFIALFLVSFLFSSVGLLVMSSVKTYESFSLAYAILLLPMYLLSGALFPLEDLPDVYLMSSLALPLTHAILFLRAGLIESGDLQFFTHFAILLVSVMVALRISILRFEKRFKR